MTAAIHMDTSAISANTCKIIRQPKADKLSYDLQQCVTKCLHSTAHKQGAAVLPQFVRVADNCWHTLLCDYSW